MPVGWEFRGGCHWLLDNPGMPAVVSFQLFNPQGPEALEVLPNMNFTWNNNPMTKMMFPPGKRYFGAEVFPPVNCHDAFHQYVLPRYRSFAEGLQVVREELQPDLPRLVRSEAASSGGWAEGEKLRARYRCRGIDFEEEFYGVVEVFRAPIAGLFGRNEVFFWLIDYLFSFRAGAGRLDAVADLFTIMITSFKLNPQWSASYKTVIQSLAQQQIQHIHHVGQIGEIIAHAGQPVQGTEFKGLVRPPGYL